MKFIMVFMILCVMFTAKESYAHTVFSPEGKNMKIHWAVLESKPGRMSDMAAISVRTVAKSTPNESGTYSLYGAVDAANHDIMRLLEIYEDEDAYTVHTSSEGFKAFVEERKSILESVKFLPVDAVVLEQKKEGKAKTIILSLIEVKNDNLEEFKASITQEMTRAVAEVPGIMGMFATSEKGERKNFIHTMEIYADDEAQKEYTNSSEYKSYRKKADVMTESRKDFPSEPANITLSSKG
ncbi:MAG: antibiotic biosynthesis monooxygenase, partial [Synergistaceae bacterium]|nr:antibiotic biosynthesis monooxygenase [Synergistaceae bacterium]